MPTAATIVTGGLIALALLLWKAQGKCQHSARRIKATFGLHQSYRLIATDLGPHKNSKRITADDLAGVPDALFSKGNTIVVGEYKHRNQRNHVRKHERYQVMLYMGMLKTRYPAKNVSGILQYRDGRVEVKFSAPEYRWLLSLRAGCLKAKARHQ